MHAIHALIEPLPWQSRQRRKLHNQGASAVQRFIRCSRLTRVVTMGYRSSKVRYTPGAVLSMYR